MRLSPVVFRSNARHPPGKQFTGLLRAVQVEIRTHQETVEVIQPQPPTPTPMEPVADPAAQYCINQGGTNTTQTRGDGGEYGVCVFDDNRQCDAWAMYRGECPVGGVKISG